MKNTVNIQGYEFEIAKHRCGYTGVKYNMHLGHHTRTKKEFLNLQDELNREILAKGIDVKKHVKQAQVATHFTLINKVFQNAVGFPIPYNGMIKCLCNRYVFDVVYFDRLVGTPENTSCKEHIKNKYGSYALRVVEFCLEYM